MGEVRNPELIALETLRTIQSGAPDLGHGRGAQFRGNRGGEGLREFNEQHRL